MSLLTVLMETSAPRPICRPTLRVLVKTWKDSVEDALACFGASDDDSDFQQQFRGRLRILRRVYGCFLGALDGDADQRREAVLGGPTVSGTSDTNQVPSANIRQPARRRVV